MKIYVNWNLVSLTLAVVFLAWVIWAFYLHPWTPWRAANDMEQQMRCLNAEALDLFAQIGLAGTEVILAGGVQVRYRSPRPTPRRCARAGSAPATGGSAGRRVHPTWEPVQQPQPGPSG